MQLIITGFKHIHTSFNSHVHIQYSNQGKGHMFILRIKTVNISSCHMSIYLSHALWMLPAQASPMLVVGGLKPNMVYI